MYMPQSASRVRKAWLYIKQLILLIILFCIEIYINLGLPHLYI